MQLPDGEGEAAVGAVDSEEDHGDVLGGACGGPGPLGGAVVGVALVQGQRVVPSAGEPLPLQNPAIKYLPEGRGGAFSFPLTGIFFCFSHFERLKSEPNP